MDHKYDHELYTNTKEKQNNLKKVGIIFLCVLLFSFIIRVFFPADKNNFNMISTELVEEIKSFYYIDEFLDDYNIYNEVTGGSPSMYLFKSKEMDILFLYNIFNVSTDRNSSVLVELFRKADYKNPKNTVRTVSTPYLRMIEVFNTNYYDINVLKESYIDNFHFRGYIVPNQRVRDYAKRSFVSIDDRGNNQFLFEDPTYYVIENIDRKAYKDINYNENHKIHSLFPIKAYATFIVDKESVLSNQGYVIKIEEENKKGDRFSYEIKIIDKEFLKFKATMNKELEDYNTNL